MFLFILLQPGMVAHAQCVPPPAPVVVPNPAVVCINNGPVKLVVQSTALSSQFCSGPVNIAVPDGTMSGASNSITVAGIPAACTVSNMAVTINMTHSWMGDMTFVLKSPNGQIINLDYRLAGTGGAGTTTGFVNTVISSTGTTILSSGTNPWTGTYRADLWGATANPPSGPTGYLPTSTTWNGLYTIPNGSWTLAFYDGATGETGILNSWCLNFTYACSMISAAAPAIWSPATGLYLDPACTIPYVTGTQTDSVYARPVLPGIHTYQVTHNSLTTPPCTSPPASVTVTVGMTNTITQQPIDQKICLGKNAAFTVLSTGTGLSYQWQESTNGGATFTNLINGGVYSGANTATLTVTAPSLSMNGNRYRVIINGAATCAPATSNPAVLTVNPLPAVSFYPHPYHLLLPGLTTTLSSAVTPNPASTYTWFYNGLPVPGGIADTLLVDFNHIGLYHLQVTDINGCTGVSDTMSIRDSLYGKMFVYPNPSNGSFQARLYSTPNTPVARTLILYDNMGNKVVSKPYTQTTAWQQIDVDVRKNGKGIYWVEIVDKEGKRISISRILIQ